MAGKFTRTIVNTTAGLTELAGAMEKSEVYTQLPADLRYATDIVIDEMVSNVVKYAPEGEVEVTTDIRFDGWELRITLTDNGPEFDPWQVAPPPVTPTGEGAEGLQVGGRGIHMVRQLAQRYEYDHLDGQNIITFIKKVERRSAEEVEG